MATAGQPLKILLSGMVAGDPCQGGATWAVLQYFIGLAQLGHDVLLVEPLQRGKGPDPLDEGSEVAAYFHSLSSLEGRAALLVQGTEDTLGIEFDELVEFASGADLLLNISGMLHEQRLIEPIPVRAFLDLDPGFNQVWHESGTDIGLDLHTHFVTVGQCVGRADCAIPDCGREWIPTLPPVTLDHWPNAPAAPLRDAFTSVGHWRSYGSMEYGGVHYGQRAHSLRKLIDLPQRVDASFQLALGIHPDETPDLEALGTNGWQLLDPYAVAASPSTYADFVRGSRAELSVAKSGYVASRSGWFSDRSACYLASGRPVVAQETGFSDFLPVGAGLLSFVDSDDAAAAVRQVNGSWKEHSAAARKLAETFLDARKVLSDLLGRLIEPADAADRVPLGEDQRRAR